MKAIGVSHKLHDLGMTDEFKLIMAKTCQYRHPALVNETVLSNLHTLLQTFATTYKNLPSVVLKAMACEAVRFVVPSRAAPPTAAVELRKVCSSRQTPWLFEKVDVNKLKWCATPMEKSQVYTAVPKVKKGKKQKEGEGVTDELPTEILRPVFVGKDGKTYP
eukprot:626890-Karenia_brevis.AAC.1